jgi:hypothetical protein
MQYSCREVDSQEEKALARSIVLAEYVRSGYIDQSAVATGARDILPSDQAVASASGVTLVIPHEKKIIGTVSIILDSPSGFPMDSLYKEELDCLREEGKCLAEVVQLATDRTFESGLLGIGGGLALLFALFRGVLRFGEERGIDGFCITVNPKHNRFYEELGFVSIGPERSYAALGGAVTVPKVLYWKEVLQSSRRKRGLFRLLLDAV